MVDTGLARGARGVGKEPVREKVKREAERVYAFWDLQGRCAEEFRARPYNPCHDN